MSFIAEIPFRAYWSTPFCKWQGALQHLHPLRFAAHVAKQELAARSIASERIDHAVLGTTVISHHAFFGLPWVASMAGLGHVTGPTILQACATGARCLHVAASEIQSGMAHTSLIFTTDRISNGPHIYYPEPGGPGGTGTHEDWVMDNFSFDPAGGNSMIQTAENVARRHGITTAEQHEVVLRRYQQYLDALANDHAFQRNFIRLPFEVPRPKLDRVAQTIDGDQGIAPCTAEGLAKLKPVLPEGTVTFGGQTHPADANAGLIVARPEQAAALSADRAVRIRLLGFGQARAEQAYMPQATVPAARRALEVAGLSMSQIDAVKTHNPFAVNDIYFARETGFDVNRMNNYGCSLIYGHPQAPMGTRAVIELIEELALRGGGRGLFVGCAAGDGAMAVVLSVEVAS
jgi:acetyl-CoA acetyltransferase